MTARLIGRVIPALLGWFTLCIVMTQARPYDDSALLRILNQTNCRVPCFLGIHPGKTPVEQAIARLQAHEWVAQVYLDYTDYGDTHGLYWGWVYWDWWPDAPPTRGQPALSLHGHGGRLTVVDGIAREISFVSGTSLGSLYLSQGNPAEYSVEAQDALYRNDRWQGRSEGVEYKLRYTRIELEARAYGSCPRYSHNWQAETVITLGIQPNPFYPVKYSSDQFPKLMDDLFHHLCSR